MADKKIKKKKVSQATRKKLSRSSKLYQKVRKTTQNELDRVGKPLKGKDLTEFVKEKVYLEFKGLSPRDVKIQDIKDVVEKALNNTAVITPSLYFNPLNIPVTLISGIAWFDIDNFIEVDLAAETGGQNLRIEVNAGEYGSTGIFDLSDYIYETMGLQEIVENLRELVIEGEDYPFWEGQAVVRPNFKDDGFPDSYFIQFTLFVNNQQVPPSATFDEAQPMPLTQETLEQRRARRRDVVKRRKQLAKEKREKSRRKEMRGRERPTTKAPMKVEKEEKVVQKGFDEKRAQEIQKILDRQERLLDKEEKRFDKGLYTKKQFTAARQDIINQTNRAIEKFKKGGEV